MSPASDSPKGKSAPAPSIARAAASAPMRFMRRKSTRVLSRSNRTPLTREATSSGTLRARAVASWGYGAGRRRLAPREEAGEVDACGGQRGKEQQRDAEE